jgi:hypothetical protein
MLAPNANMNQKDLKYYFISQKASVSGRRSPAPYHVLYFSKNKQFPKIKYLISIFS